VILIGDKTDSGLGFALRLTQEDLIKHVCIVKGGIDAFAIDYPSLLKKGKADASEESSILLYENYIRKASK